MRDAVVVEAVRTPLGRRNALAWPPPSHIVAAHEARGKRVPFPERMGRAAEYADLVAFLVGNDHIDGETIRIDGAQRFGLR
jgi:NAD(P)-dependent dehydrogenase (short-subunit alcohol dehydrogenase family)